jgi:hypothetical protein
MNPKAPVPVTPKMTETGIEEQIRRRAYALYEGRGRAEGNALHDWLQAEREVLALREAKAATTSS